MAPMNKKQLVDQCWANFISSHPELTAHTPNQLVALLINEKQIYAKVSMDFTIQYMLDEKALKK